MAKTRLRGSVAVLLRSGIDSKVRSTSPRIWPYPSQPRLVEDPEGSGGLSHSSVWSCRMRRYAQVCSTKIARARFTHNCAASRLRAFHLGSGSPPYHHHEGSWPRFPRYIKDGYWGRGVCRAPDVLENSIPVTQLCVEFHHRWHEIGVSRTREAISALRARGYRIFHISDSGEEYSFLGP